MPLKDCVEIKTSKSGKWVEKMDYCAVSGRCITQIETDLDPHVPFTHQYGNYVANMWVLYDTDPTPFEMVSSGQR